MFNYLENSSVWSFYISKILSFSFIFKIKKKINGKKIDKIYMGSEKSTNSLEAKKE